MSLGTFTPHGAAYVDTAQRELEDLAGEIFTRAVSTTSSDLNSIASDHTMACGGKSWLEGLARAAFNAAAAFLAETERRRTETKP